MSVLVITNLIMINATRIAGKVVTRNEIFFSYASLMLARLFIGIVDPFICLAFNTMFREQAKDFLVNFLNPSGTTRTRINQII